MASQPQPETPPPEQPVQPTEAPAETPPLAPDIDVPSPQVIPEPPTYPTG